MVTKTTPVVSYGRVFSTYYTRADPTKYPFPGNGSWSFNYNADTVSGASNPLWRDQILKGQNATTNYRRLRTIVTPPYLSVLSEPPSNYYSGPLSDYFGLVPISFAGLNSVPSSLEASTRDIAVGRMRNRLGNESQSFNALVPLGEIKELRALLTHGHGSVVGACTDIVQQLLKIKRGIANPRRAFKAAQNAWLTWSFGIKPTLSDISAIGNSIAAYLNKPERNVVVTGSKTSEWSESIPASGITGGYGFTIGGTHELRKTLSFKYICCHRFFTRATKDYSLLDQLGFNIPSLVPAAWELIPYSWIVDYFTTAGQFLEDTFTSISGSSVYVVENRKLLVEGRITARPVASGGYSQTVRSSKNGYYQFYDFARTGLSSIPSRSLRFKSIDEVGINGVNRLLNLTALLRF